MGEKMIDERGFYRVQERDKEEKRRKGEGREGEEEDYGWESQSKGGKK